MRAFIQWSLCTILFLQSEARNRHSDGRYSYSLSTFDVFGKLAQVEYAIAAANLGTPIIAVATETAIFMAAPEVVSSPLLIQDGTARFFQITDEIILAHTGLSADGRIVAAAAQRLAVEHEYTFDENIPIEIFLQEISLLLQEYTIKAATRPFGTNLLIGYNPKANMLATYDTKKPSLFRIDPSGTITKGQTMVMNEALEQTDVLQSLETMTRLSSHGTQDAMRNVLRSALSKIDKKKAINDEQEDFDGSHFILSASLARNGRMSVERHGLSAEAD